MRELEQLLTLLSSQRHKVLFWHKSSGFFPVSLFPAYLSKPSWQTTSVQEENPLLQTTNQAQVLKIVELLPDALEKSQHTTDYGKLIRDTRVVASVLYSQETITTTKPETALLLSPPFIEWFNQSDKVKEKKIEEKNKAVEITKPIEEKIPEKRKKEQKRLLTKESKIDFAIITAIELERRAICQAFQITDDDRVVKESRIYWCKSLELRDDEFYTLVIAQAPDMATSVDAALLVSDTNYHWHPGAILLVGIAAGVDREKQQFGDLVIGSDIYYYERGKLTSKGKRPDPFMYRADATLWNHIRAVSEWFPPNTLLRPDGTQTRPKIHYGVIASGEKVIADRAVRDEIAAETHKLVAFMNDYGLSAGVWNSPQGVRPLVIKAICDFADAEKHDDWQAYAATIAAEFTKHFLLERPLSPLNPPYPIIPPFDNREYRPITKLITHALKNGSLVPFLGPDINPSFYIDLALRLTESMEQELESTQQNSSNSYGGGFIRKLMGSSLSEEDFFPQELPEDSPGRLWSGSLDDDPAPFHTRNLRAAKRRLRTLSYYYILKSNPDTLYAKLYEMLEKIECKDSQALHQFLAALPRLMISKGYPQRSPGLPYQLIVTTNYDDILEQAFSAMKQPFDVVFYVADGDERGKFKHQTYEGNVQTIETQAYDKLPLRSPWGNAAQPRPIILKLFGDWRNLWDNGFVTTNQQFTFLIDKLTQNLPDSLKSVLGGSKILFMGYSPGDTDLDRIIHCLWPGSRIPNKSYLLHQAQSGDLEQEIWTIRNVDLLNLPFSLDNFVTQLKGEIEAYI